MLRRFYDWVISHAEQPYAVWLMGAISFAESSFLPLPPDVLLVPMMLAQRQRAIWYATVATVTSVVGGYLGYAIGHFLYQSVGLFLIEHFWTVAGFEHAKSLFAANAFWLIVGKGLTPIPYKIVTILCGVMDYDLLKFTIASILARGVRFYAEALLLYFYGEPVRDFIEHRLVLVTSGVFVLLVGAFAAFKLL